MSNHNSGFKPKNTTTTEAPPLELHHYILLGFPSIIGLLQFAPAFI